MKLEAANLTEGLCGYLWTKQTGCIPKDAIKVDIIRQLTENLAVIKNKIWSIKFAYTVANRCIQKKIDSNYKGRCWKYKEIDDTFNHTW